MAGTRKVAALAVVAVGILAAVAVPAQATYPGANGRIAFAANGNTEDYEIWTMAADGTDRVRLTDNSVDDVAPAYSADGAKIAFQRQNDIYVMNADGSGVVRLTNNTVYESEPAFSPDGTKIVFARQVGGADLEIMRMNADGSGVTQLTNNTRDDLEPSFSPDGTRILYTHLANDGHFDIYRIKTDGTNSTRITDCGGVADCMQSDYSPNGQKITYTRWNWADENNVFSEVFVAAANGTGPVMKTVAGGYYNYSSFSPDGGYLVYAGGPDYELFRMNLANGNVLRLTDTFADAYDAAWQPV